MKKVIGLFLILTLACNMFSAMGEGKTYTSGDFTYTKGENKTAIITKYNGNVSELAVPKKLNGRKVIGIDQRAFYGCISLTSVVLFNGIQSIGDYAFCNCENLKNITIPDSVIDIGRAAFFECNSLSEVTIPQNVKYIGPSAFGDCDVLTGINVHQENPVYEQIDGVLFDKTQHILHTYPKGKTDEYYRIPDGTLSIGDYAFNLALNLKKVTVPSSVTTIGNNAFYCAFFLTEAELQDGLTTILDGAFGYCVRLANLTIPDSVINIGKAVFERCDQLILTAEEGSLAHKYAVKNNIPTQLP